MPESAEECFEMIGDALVSRAPEDWRSLEIIYYAVAGATGYRAVAQTSTGVAVALSGLPEELHVAFTALRAGYYRPGEGAWYAAYVTLLADGDFTLKFDHDHEPELSELATPADYVADLELFPRDEQTWPQWLREKVAQARADPKSHPQVQTDVDAGLGPEGDPDAGFEGGGADAEAAGAARSVAWSTLGTLDPLVITHLINPAFMGGPAWPALRQAFVRVQRPHTTLLATDGLSDPYDRGEGPLTGVGLELVVESTDPALRQEVQHLSGHWLFQVLYQVAQNAADIGPRLREMLDTYGVLSLALPIGSDERVPDGWLNNAAEIGVLLGMPTPSLPASVDVPAGAVRLVPVVVLRPSELEAVVNGGAPARQEVVDRLAACGAHSVVDSQRPALL